MHGPDTFSALDITFATNGLVLVEQDDGGGNLDRIALHPAHVEHMAGRLGLIPEGALNALRHVAMLRRRLETLRYRLDRLTEMLNLCGDHENLQPEQDYAMATWEIATEFCEDFDQAFPEAFPKGSSPGAATAPETPVTPASKPAPRTARPAQLTIEGTT